MIGERTNITGSKRFSRLVLSGDYEGALAVARQQVEGGANVLDVNMDEGLLDSHKAMTTFLNLVGSEPEISRLPIMVDSSKFSVIEEGLKRLQGDRELDLAQGGEEAFRGRRGSSEVRGRCRGHGLRRRAAATVDRKVEILSRAYRILTERSAPPGHRLRSEHPDRRDGHRRARHVRG
jgi:5-methyltetrahydrofolate--homocysteine methyltransferase